MGNSKLSAIQKENQARQLEQNQSIQKKNSNQKIQGNFDRDAMVLQNKVGNQGMYQLMKESVQKSESSKSMQMVEAMQHLEGDVAQLSIGCHANALGAPQFQIDNIRPAWEVEAAAIVLGMNEHRCHTIGFEVIQNDLANILNAMLASRGTANFAADRVRLDNLCDSLFTTAGAERNRMNARKQAVANDINALPGVPNAAQFNNLTQRSGVLLSSLNSCTDNLRAGDGGLNQAIGYNIDAEFLPGTLWYHGPALIAGPNPPVQVPPPGTAVVGGGGLNAVGPIECVRLAAPFEQSVYNYQGASTLPLAFVLSGIGGALYPGTVAGQQLSSTQMPTAAGHPVIVFGGLGQVPMMFQ